MTVMLLSASGAVRGCLNDQGVTDFIHLSPHLTKCVAAVMVI